MSETSNTFGESVLAISERSDIWSVTLNGAFFGDYVREQWAIEAALQKAREIEQTGKAVCVTILRAEEWRDIHTLRFSRRSGARVVDRPTPLARGRGSYVQLQ
jgi:hypothetical protein